MYARHLEKLLKAALYSLFQAQEQGLYFHIPPIPVMTQ